MVSLLKEAAKNGKERVVRLPDGKMSVTVSASRYKYLLNLERKTIEKQAEDFLKALDIFRVRGNVKTEIALQAQGEMVTRLEENFCQLALSRPTCVHSCLLLRRYGICDDDSARKTDTLNVVYHDHDFVKRKRLFDDNLEPMKSRASKEEYNEAWNEVLEMTRNSILLFYGSRPDMLKEYVNQIRGIGLDLEDCWDEYVFKHDASTRNKEEIDSVLTFKRGTAMLADKHGTYSPALKAQFAKNLNLSEIFAEFNKVVQSTKPLKLIFQVEVETSLESLLRMNLTRSGIIRWNISYHTERFGASYYRSSMLNSQSYLFGCGANNLEELIAFLRLLGYEK